MAKINSRPVRLCTFVVSVISTEELAGVSPKSKMVGEVSFKSDVHYCAEKWAIDEIAARIEAGVGYEYTYIVYKVTKELTKEGNPKKCQYVSKVYADENTNQIVID